MKLYLLHTATNTFSDAADYPGGPPFEPEEGFQWAEGDPDGLELYHPPTLIEQFDAIIDTQPIEVQIAFSPIIAAGELFIRTNRLDRLLALIQSISDPAVAEVKQQMLTLLEG